MSQKQKLKISKNSNVSISRSRIDGLSRGTKIRKPIYKGAWFMALTIIVIGITGCASISDNEDMSVEYRWLDNESEDLREETEEDYEAKNTESTDVGNSESETEDSEDAETDETKDNESEEAENDEEKAGESEETENDEEKAGEPAESGSEGNATESEDDMIDGMRKEFKDAMDSYEAFYDEYCDFMKKYSENPSDLTLIAEYGNMVAKLAEMDKKFEEWDNGELNNEEAKYYVEVTARIAQKLISIME